MYSFLQLWAIIAAVGLIVICIIAGLAYLLPLTPGWVLIVVGYLLGTAFVAFMTKNSGGFHLNR